MLSTASPYKFPGAVLHALGGSVSGDDFADLALLEQLTGVPAPKVLRELRDKKIRFEEQIEPEQILAVARAL